MELFPIQRGVVATNQAEKKFISERFGSETLNKNCNNVRRALKTKALTLKHLKANFTDFLGGEFRNELMTFYELNISSGPKKFHFFNFVKTPRYLFQSSTPLNL